MDDDKQLATFLKDRRTRLDPAAFGFSGRRRTAGLRREEVAQRAGISTTWYTWLEQGRGGPPSPEVLERLTDALMLTDAERDHLFLVGIGRPPKARSEVTEGITPRLQRLLDALKYVPAIIVTPHWDIVAWNMAARLVLRDYPTMEPNDRNILRRIFLDAHERSMQEDWESIARFLIATFRAETAKLGQDERTRELISELSASSSEFKAMWSDNEVSATGEGLKRLKHPIMGRTTFEYSSFSVDGRPDLRLVAYTPASEKDARSLEKLFNSSDSTSDK